MMKALMLVGCAAMVLAEGPALAVYKTLSMEDAVEGHNLTVTVQIYNLGDTAAHNVELDDNQWSNAQGGYKNSWDKIESGAVEVSSYTVVPDAAGKTLGVEPAKVTFKVSEASESVRAAFSNNVYDTTAALGLPILTQAEFDKKASHRVKEWLTFLLLLFVPLGIPFFLFHQSKNNIDARRAQGIRNLEKAAPKKSSSPTKKSASPTKKSSGRK
eukprot:TRINITY_DN4654_c0_g1_i1.p1 TRINITY_DN4654_c0_g1~~TRINITY_DN4654_c0_g1_i1.p1  ORF type:complete len:214 (+),score=90.94 TRINITY_DN4654_c0_g1_i1:70-711(+)